MDITLNWHGPFSVINGETDPRLFSADPCIVRQCGVYLWTIPRGAEHLVAYVGMTHGKTVNFCKRLKQELWIDWPEYFHIPDVPKLKQDIKEWIYKPLSWGKIPDSEAWELGESQFRQAWQQYLRLLRVFVAPMADQPQQIRATETALIRAVWDHENATRPETEEYFLQNVHEPRRLTCTYRVRSVAPMALRGITPEIFSD